MIKENFRQIRRGRKVADRDNNIVIKIKLTGSHKGGNYSIGRVDKLSFKVIAGGREFFVKSIKRRPEAVITLRGMRLLNGWLKDRRYLVKGFKVKLIKPLLIYERSGQAFLVTRFYKANQVKQIRDIKGDKGTELTEALEFIKQEFEKTGQHLREIDPKKRVL